MGPSICTQSPCSPHGVSRPTLTSRRGGTLWKVLTQSHRSVKGDKFLVQAEMSLESQTLHIPTRKCGDCDALQLEAACTPRHSLSTLIIRRQYQGSSQSTYLLLPYSVFTADTLRYVVTFTFELSPLTVDICSISTLTFYPLTLNVCSIMWSKKLHHFIFAISLSDLYCDDSLVQLYINNFYITCIFHILQVSA